MNKSLLLAEELSRTVGVPESNCYKCKWAVNLDGGFVRCEFYIAKFILEMLEKGLLDSSQGSYFPTFTGVFDGEAITSPSVITSDQAGVDPKFVWPKSFDPIHILFCLFYLNPQDEQKDKQENPPASGG